MVEIQPMDPSTLQQAGIAIADENDIECPPGCILIEIPNGLKVAVGQPPIATYNLLGEILR